MLQRILAVILKELATLWKDPKTRGVLIVPPIVQILLFAYAANYDVTGVRLAVWNEDRGVQGDELARRFAASPAFRVVAVVAAPVAAAASIDAKDAAAVLRIPQGFSADVTAGRTTHVQLLLDARRSNTALLINGYAADIVAAFVQEAGAGRPAPLELEARDWFNPTLDSQWFILPGLVVVLSMTMSMLVSSLSLARERELGTFEQLMVTPLGAIEILIGKAVPALLVGLLEANIVVTAALTWFALPMAGSPLLLEGALCVFILAGVGVGLAITSVVRTQQQAILGVFIYAAPAIILSGFASPIENMPPFFELLSRIDPIRYMLVIARGAFLQDMPLAIAIHQIWPMALIAVALLGIATVTVRRALTL
jgi:ABC-2 type transport system permease protein